MNNIKVAELIDLMNQFRDEKDFRKNDTIQVLAKSIVIEANELLEEVYHPSNQDNLKGEVADIFMYLLALVDYYNFDVEEIINNKIDIVRERVYE